MITEEIRQNVFRRVKKALVASKIVPVEIRLECSDDTVMFLNGVREIYYERLTKKLRRHTLMHVSSSHANVKWGSDKVLRILDGHLEPKDRLQVPDKAI